MNFIKQKYFNLLEWSSSLFQRVWEALATAQMWHEYLKRNEVAKDKDAPCMHQALNSHQWKMMWLWSLSSGSPMGFAWLTFLCVCVCLCMFLCVFLVSFSAKHSTPQNNRSNKFSHKQTQHCSSITLCTWRIYFLLKTSCEMNHFSSSSDLGIEQEESRHSWLETDILRQA